MSHRIAIEGTDVTFECDPGQSLLDAALKSGLWFQAEPVKR